MRTFLSPGTGNLVRKKRETSPQQRCKYPNKCTEFWRTKSRCLGSQSFLPGSQSYDPGVAGEGSAQPALYTSCSQFQVQPCTLHQPASGPAWYTSPASFRYSLVHFTSQLQVQPCTLPAAHPNSSLLLSAP